MSLFIRFTWAGCEISASILCRYYNLHDRTTCNIKFVSTLAPDWTVYYPCISRKLDDRDHSLLEAFPLLQYQVIVLWCWKQYHKFINPQWLLRCCCIKPSHYGPWCWKQQHKLLNPREKKRWSMQKGLSDLCPWADIRLPPFRFFSTPLSTNSSRLEMKAKISFL